MGPSSVVAERANFWQSAIAAVQGELAAGTPAADVPNVLVEKKVLSRKIDGYEPDQMRIFFRRITSYALTGE